MHLPRRDANSMGLRPRTSSSTNESWAPQPKSGVAHALTLQFARRVIGFIDGSLYPESGRRRRPLALHLSSIAVSKQLRHNHGPLRSLPNSSG
jgi:hypothetical protein